MTNIKTPSEVEKKKPEKPVDDKSAIHVESHIKIFDPVSGTVFYKGRA